MSIELSYICPTYNRAEMLEHCVRSVLGNPYAENWEIIIVDDGSLDRTPILCKELEAIFGADRIHVSRSEVRMGAQVCRNRGTMLARGRYVAYVDSDDAIEPAGVVQLIVVLENNSSLDYAYGSVVYTDAEFVTLQDAKPVGSSFTDNPIDIAGYHWHTMGAIYRRNFLVNVGPWNTDLSCWQDSEYQARVKISGGLGQFVNVVVGYWRQHHCDRIALEAFSVENNASAIHASKTILNLARKKGRCDRTLENRLVLRMIVLALKFGYHGHGKKQREALILISTAIHQRHLLQICIFVLRFVPATFAYKLAGLLQFFHYGTRDR